MTQMDDLLTRKFSDSCLAGIFEPSASHWRAQVVVAKDLQNRHKKRLCADYSNTVNVYTELNAYPVPRIDAIINKLSEYKVFSAFDLKSAYHQIKKKESDKVVSIYSHTFGVENGVAAFQRTVDNTVEEDNLDGTFRYIDNVLIGGDDQEDHDLKVNNFLESVAHRGLTINDSKTVKSVQSLNTLGCCIGNGIIKPDSENLVALQELPPPGNLPPLQLALGMFAYYAKWIPQFSDKVYPLVRVVSFLSDDDAMKAFEQLKKELENAAFHTINESLPFTVECDASDVPVSATLNQRGRLVEHSLSQSFITLLLRRKPRQSLKL